jgi:hypothetical protein
MTHTHQELTDPQLRAVLARELLVLRASMRRIRESMSSDFAYGVRTGLDTFARRMQDVNKRGLESVYQDGYNA